MSFEPQSNRFFEQDEISLIELFRVFLRRKKILYSFVGLFLLVGVFIAATSKDEYTATSKLLSEDVGPSSNLKGLAGLAGIAGVNIETDESRDLPSYSAIVQSQPFLKALLSEKVYSKKLNRVLSLGEYLTDSLHATMANRALRKISTIFRSGRSKVKKTDKVVYQSQITVLTNSEITAINALKDRILVNSEDRFLNLEVRMPESVLAAEVNEIVRENLVEYIVDYKTAKRRRSVDFLETRTEEAKKKFQSAQVGLAGFQDRNLGLVVQMGKARETQLQAQYNLYFNLYSTLASQLEQARIKLKEDTPVFTVFEPVTIPGAPSAPNRIKIILLSIVIGAITGSAFIFVSIVKATFFAGRSSAATSRHDED